MRRACLVAYVLFSEDWSTWVARPRWYGSPMNREAAEAWRAGLVSPGLRGGAARSGGDFA
nr:hypothetical protein [Tolivirales sp.]